ncbi:zinc-dependent alcohol dehydrogenase family protein [Halomonas sp. AOP25-F1-15]|uniref:zinc-dependent alcohol dehydrogenase family protein n=1 Tax=Halomonas sp. AOP25-F1-15 TaxID=3457709 RepID=UPI004033F272
MQVITLQQPGGLDNLNVQQMDAPGEPMAGEIRVRLHASSLNFHDYAVVAGMIPTEDQRIPMSDGAGVVEAVGEGVTEFAAGDHVVSTFFPYWLEGPARVGDFRTTPGDGVDGYAREQVVRPFEWFTHQPKGYSHAESATLTTAGLTAWRALVVDGNIKAGDSVLVLGTGGVSIFALQFARMMGARVIATSSSNEKLARLKEMGAEHTINYKETPDWGKRVKELTDGEGVDHIVEVGGAGTLSQSIDAVKIGGKIALIGILTGREGEVPTAKLMAKQASLKGLIVGSRRHQIEMIRALEALDMHPVIDREFPLADIADAFRHQASGKHFGKICLTF